MIIGGGKGAAFNAQSFSDGSSGTYAVDITGVGLDAGLFLDVNTAVYFGLGEGGSDSWLGVFHAVNISMGGYTMSLYTDGNWFGIAAGGTSDGFAFSITEENYESIIKESQSNE